MKPDRNGYAPSIMQDDVSFCYCCGRRDRKLDRHEPPGGLAMSSNPMPDRICFLCGRNGAGDPLEVHHIFPGPLRDKSERYGLTVLLCGNRCHRLGKRSAHQCRETALMLKQYAQKKAMEENNWSLADWHREFGKSYLEEEV